VPVLGEDVQERVGRQTRADIFEREARLPFSLDPKIDGRNPVAFGDRGIGKVQLPIELQRAGLDGKGARGRPGLGGLVDDAEP